VLEGVVVPEGPAAKKSAKKPRSKKPAEDASAVPSNA